MVQTIHTINSQSLTFCCCTCLATYKQLCVKRSAACKPFLFYFSKIIKSATLCRPPLSPPSRCFRCRLVLIVITIHTPRVNTFFTLNDLFLPFFPKGFLLARVAQKLQYNVCVIYFAAHHRFVLLRWYLSGIAAESLCMVCPISLCVACRVSFYLVFIWCVEFQCTVCEKYYSMLFLSDVFCEILDIILVKRPIYLCKFWFYRFAATVWIYNSK